MQGYDVWVERYTRLFCLNRPEDGPMLSEWELAFDKHNFTVEDLNAAADHLAGNPPQTRPAHLRALMEFCKGRRRNRPAPIVLGVNCSMCHNTGAVVVPHIVVIEKGHGWATMAVKCMCAHGQARTIPGMNFEQYDRRCPDWRKYLEERRQDWLAKSGLLQFADDEEGLLRELERRKQDAKGLVKAVAAGIRMPRQAKPQPPPKEWRV